MAGDDRLPARCRARKLVPKWSAPLSTATAAIRPHWSRGGALTNQASSSTSIARRTAVNRNGGISRSACAEARKLKAQNTHTRTTRPRSRPPSPRSAGLMRLPPPAQAAIELGQHPGRADQQIAQVGEEARLAAFV